MTTVSDPVPTFLIMLLRGNSADKKKIFCGKNFIVAGLFEEVSYRAKIALDIINIFIANSVLDNRLRRGEFSTYARNSTIIKESLDSKQNS